MEIRILWSGMVVMIDGREDTACRPFTRVTRYDGYDWPRSEIGEDGNINIKESDLDIWIDEESHDDTLLLPSTYHTRYPIPLRIPSQTHHDQPHRYHSCGRERCTTGVHLPEYVDSMGQG